MVGFEIAVVLVLFVLNGFFAMAELAIVSSRRTRLGQFAEEGRAGAKIALALLDDSSRMFAAMQVGFTTTSTIAGIFSGATIGHSLGDVLATYPPLAPYAQTIALIVVTIAVTYAALVIGELVPKQIALSNPEPIAMRVARPIALLARAAAPIVWILKKSTQALLFILRVHPHAKATLTEDDIHLIIDEGARLGVIHNVERDMIEGVLDLADSPVRTIMTPRPRLQWVDLEASGDDIVKEIRACPHGQLLACRGSLDDLVGILRKQDLLSETGPYPQVANVVQAPLVIHESTPILRTLDLFRKQPVHTAVIVDEFGSVQGVVTRTDLLEAVAGDLPSLDGSTRPIVAKRDDGSFLVDATTSFTDVAERIGRDEAPPGDFVSLGGFLMWKLNHVHLGDYVDWGGWRFEVADMDGHRIKTVRVQRVPEAAAKRVEGSAA
jgi:putative hemolysin